MYTLKYVCNWSRTEQKKKRKQINNRNKTENETKVENENKTLPNGERMHFQEEWWRVECKRWKAKAKQTTKDFNGSARDELHKIVVCVFFFCSA